MEGNRRTVSEIAVFGKILRTCRKFAAARNFLAVDLKFSDQDWTSSKSGHHKPGCIAVSVFVVCVCENLEGKLFHVSRTDRFDVNSVAWANICFHLLQYAKECKECVPRWIIASLEGDTELGGIVGT